MFSNMSSMSDEIDSMTDRLNVIQFDEVVQHLREFLEEEVSQLLKDITFLQGCLDDEANFRDQSEELTEPTLHDLREERSRLEKEMLSADGLSNPEISPKVNKPMKSITPAVHSGAMSKLKPVPPVGPNPNQRRLGPVKATHNFTVKIIDLPNNRNPTPTTTIADTLDSKTSVDSPVLATKDPRPSSADRFRKMVAHYRDN